MRDIKSNLRNCDAWKIELTIEINLIFSRDSEEECAIHSNSGSIKFTSFNDANKVVDEIFESLRLRYQDNLETSVRGNKFIFDPFQMMHYKRQKKILEVLVHILILQTG